MSRKSWVTWVAAAIVVLLAGAVLVAAEERIEVRVEKHDGDEVTVDINGAVEVIHLDDLTDGESRRFDVGDHELVVTRAGDELTVLSEGHGFWALDGDGDHAMVWVRDDGERVEIDDTGSTSKVMVVSVDGAEDGDGDATTYSIRLDGDDVMLDGEQVIEIDEIVIPHAGSGPRAVFVSESGAHLHPGLLRGLGGHGDLVRYRCDESGSVLLVPVDDAIEDVYVCPATGCLMNRVEEPEVRVITLSKKSESDDSDE